MAGVAQLVDLWIEIPEESNNETPLSKYFQGIHQLNNLAFLSLTAFLFLWNAAISLQLRQQYFCTARP